MSRVLGIGVDLTQMPRMRRVVARWDERFLQRVFTEQEIAYCRRRRDPIPHFAARFAAKEATLKALGTGLRMGVNWRELEVRRERGQAPTMTLSGRSREIASVISRRTHGDRTACDERIRTTTREVSSAFWITSGNDSPAPIRSGALPWRLFPVCATIWGKQRRIPPG